MSITLTPISHGDLCHGARWAVDDINVLAERVARVALGQYRHVAQILSGLNALQPKAAASFVEDAKNKLQVAENGDPWHRDGWLFQIISWITASQNTPPGTVLRPPHIFKAHKGFDGMQLVVDASDKSITAVVIFEDKATTNPRKTIRDEVWPAIVLLEKGERITELAHEATGLIEAHQHTFQDINVDEAIDRIVWQEARRYRVSITTAGTHYEDADRKRLFKGYDTTVGETVVRRCAETMHLDDLRDWMEKFAALVADKIDEVANV